MVVAAFRRDLGDQKREGDRQSSVFTRSLQPRRRRPVLRLRASVRGVSGSSSPLTMQPPNGGERGHGNPGRRRGSSRYVCLLPSFFKVQVYCFEVNMDLAPSLDLIGSTGMGLNMQYKIAHIAVSNLPTIPLYVYEIQMTNLTKGKMAFSLPFSKQYINNHLSTPIDDLLVTLVGSAESFEMRLKKSKDKRATFTTRWNKLVQANLFELGDVCVFLFTEVDDDLCITLEVLN
ncbi:hypothetical protein OsJ_15715 [Oryza sativa Japonica Group]|uniref:TF-B3 domain-containing protein n=1 Tax=Oryza sativa subsp. japonica TaxID=39947 RepID=B9FGH9_ORYSJ|nr:hypothetical protein OsJ_15715 [Oryza sativa Japonica Group]